MTFLRSRICGDLDEDDDGDNALNSSLFVAGPPGTGKTASVLSIIARLRLEQAKGNLPAFEFVSLNGMEMRHPFEAYVKFWEVISGPEKEKKPREIAAELLERRFAGRKRDGDEKTRPVVVLLLDEIDYLMTKKQTVLYTFFDWPVTSCENGNGARLIVVGISNTLNLSSRLKPSVQSRLGGKVCHFRAYNVNDMMAILKSKIQSNKSVRDDLAPRSDNIASLGSY
jgi:origin recognition complex subunit 1